MKRLIERAENGQVMIAGCGGNCKHEYKHCYNAMEDCPTINEIYEKLASYEDAEEQGKLVLYPTNAYFIMNNKVCSGWVQEIAYSVCRKPLYDIRYDDKSLASYKGYLGNTVFITEAEAEQALAEMKGGNVIKNLFY